MFVTRIVRAVRVLLLLVLLLSTRLYAQSSLKGNVTSDGFAGVASTLVSVDQSSGAAVSSYRFLVPIGRSGLQPDLTIAYSSSATGGGILGRGWSLNLSSIQRDTRRGQPTFTPSDRFVLRWQGRALNLTRKFDRTVNGIGEREFRTDNESFMKIVSHSTALNTVDTWEVWDGSGRRYEFGGTTRTSAVAARVNNFTWALSRIVDPYGNYMEFDYYLNAGVLYPSNIRYAGNDSGLPAPNRVQFYYEGRPDVVSSRMGGTSEINYRLRHIKTFVDEVPVRAYLFDYNTLGIGVNPVNPCAPTTCAPTATLCPNGNSSTCENTCQPSTGLCTACQPAACTWCTGRDCGRVYRECSEGQKSCAIPCDPIAEVCGTTCTPPQCKKCVKFCDQVTTVQGGSAPVFLLDGTEEPLFTSAPAVPTSAAQTTAITSAALIFTDQDKPSLLTRITQYDGPAQAQLPPTNFTYTENVPAPALWAASEGVSTATPFIQGICGTDTQGRPARTVFDKGSFVFDTWEDYAVIRGEFEDCSDTLIGTAPDYFVATPCAVQGQVAAGGSISIDGGSRVVDINGDGRLDIIRSVRDEAAGAVTSVVYLGGAKPEVSGYTVPVPFVQWNVDAVPGSNIYWADDLGVRFGDVNGDGLVDIIQSVDWSNNCQAKEQGVYLNTGNGWGPKQTGWAIPATFVTETCGTGSYDNGLRLMDVNNDGMADLVKSMNGETPSVWLSHGQNDGVGTPWEKVTGWDLPAEPFTYRTTDGGVRFGDVNADGLVDIIVSKMWDGTRTRKVYLHRGGKGWAEGAAWSGALPDFDFMERVSSTLGGFELGVRLANNSANNAVDYVLSRTMSGCPQPTTFRIYRSQAVFSDLMKTSTSPLGGTTTITYGSSAKNQTLAPSQIGFAMPVVTRIVQNDGLTETQTGSVHSYTTDYRYGGGFYHRKSREFRGFRYVTTILPGARARLEQRFVQDPSFDVAPLAGTLERSALRKSTGEILAVTDNVFTRQARTITLPEGGTAPAEPPFFDFLQTSDEYHLDWAQATATLDNVSLAAPVKRKRMGYAYTFVETPEAGRQIASRQIQALGDFSRTADDLFTTEEFINDTASWKLRVLKRRYDSSVATEPIISPSPILTDTWFLYDGRAYGEVGDGDLTTIEQWPGGQQQIRFQDSGVNILTTMGYDAYGHMTKLIDAEGHTTCTFYGGADPTFTFPYQTKTVPTPDCGASSDHVTGIETDRRFGLVSNLTTPSDGTVTVEYDRFGRTSKIYNSLDSAALPTSCYTYDLAARPALVASFQRERSAQGETCGTNGMLSTVSFVDGLGRTIQSKQESAEPGFASLVVGATLFNSEGRRVATKKPFFNADPLTSFSLAPTAAAALSLAYDEAGRQLTSTLPGLHGVGTRVVRSEYPGWTVRTFDVENRKAEMDYDGFGRIAERRIYTPDAGGGELVTEKTTFTYDRLGRTTAIQDYNGNLDTFTYDGLGRLLASTRGQYETTRSYNRDGTLASIDTHQGSASGQVWGGVIPGTSAAYTYDALHRKTSVRYPIASPDGVMTTGPGTFFYYDDLPRNDAVCGPSTTTRAIGHLTSVEDLETSVRQDYLYDAIGKLRETREVIPSSADPAGVCLKTGASLDAIGRLDVVTYPDNSQVAYQYGVDGNVSAIPGFASAIAYNETGDLKHLRYANGLDVTRLYDPWTSLLEKTLACFDCNLATPDNIVNAAYTYTPSGVLESITDRDATQEITNIRTFGIDRLDRIRSATATAADSYHGLNYGFDGIGNMFHKEGTVFTFAGGAEPHQATAMSVPGVAGSDRTLTYGGFGQLKSITDSQGEGRTFTYDGSGNPVRMVDSVSGQDTSYTYNPQGQRVRRVERLAGASTETLLAGRLYETTGGAYKKYIRLGGSLIAEVRGTVSEGDQSTYFYVTSNNATEVVTHSGGGLTQRIEYTPYGDVQRVSGDDFSLDYMFGGARRDPASGLYDFGARLYDPGLGRFLAMDPLRNNPLETMNQNPYAYASGNPVAMYDVAGYSSSSLCGCDADFGGAFYYVGYGNDDSRWSFGSNGIVYTGNNFTFSLDFSFGDFSSSAFSFGGFPFEPGTQAGVSAGVILPKGSQSPSGGAPAATPAGAQIGGGTPEDRAQLLERVSTLPCVINEPLQNYLQSSYGVNLKKLLESDKLHFEITTDSFYLGGNAEAVRGKYRGYKDTIFISPEFSFTSETFTATLLHEIGHYIAAHSLGSFRRHEWPSLGYGDPKNIDADIKLAITQEADASGFVPEVAGRMYSGFLVEYYQFGHLLTVWPDK